MRTPFAVALALGVLLLAGLAYWLLGGDGPAGTGGEAARPQEVESSDPVADPEAPSAVEPRRRAGGPEPVAVEPAELEEAVEPAPLAPARGRLAGRLSLVDGAPLPGVDVRLAGTPLAVRTDAEGDFVFDDLPAGVHRLQVRSSVPLPVLGPDSFEAGETDVELTVAAALARVHGERTGARVPLRRARALRIRGDGSFESLRTVGSPPAGAESIDLVLPAGSSVLVHGEDADGVLAAFIDTPPDGGRIGVVTRVTAGGLASLRVTVGPDSPLLAGAYARVRLRDTQTDELLEARVPCGADSVWAGLVPGSYAASVAIEPADQELSGADDLALVLPETALALEGDAETLLVVDVVPGGRIELVLPELLQGAVFDPGPLAPCVVEVSPAGGGAILPLEWLDATRDGVNAWLSDGALPAGRWQVGVRNAHVILWRGTADVASGAITRIDAR